MGRYPRKVVNSPDKLQNAYDPGDPIKEREIGTVSVAPAASSATAVHAAIALGAALADVTTAITNPDVARNVTVKGNVGGIAGNVVVTGKNAAGVTITETIALNGSTEVVGALAFEKVTKVRVPAQTHTPTAQVETATVVGTVVNPGDASVVITAAGMAGSPKTKAVAVVGSDDASAIAGKIRAALAADTAVAALFTVGGQTDKVILTAKTPAANDDTLNIAIDNGTCTGITTAGTSADTTAGVGYDTVSVGVGEKIGLGYALAADTILCAAHNGVREANHPTVTVDADEIQKNVFTLGGAADGNSMDLWFIAI